MPRRRLFWGDEPLRFPIGRGEDIIEREEDERFIGTPFYFDRV